MKHSMSSWTVPVAAVMMLFSGTALANRCGDGVLWPADGEQCDDGNLIDGDGCSSTCTVETPDPYCGDGILDLGEQCDDGNNVNGDGCSEACVIEEFPSGEGCTPGYWKVSQHLDSWPAPYTPSTQFSAVFDDAFPGMTLLQVLQQGGGDWIALGRHAVAALLNAASGDVDYGMTPADVIAAFNAAWPGGDWDSLKDDLEYANESGCPLN